MTVNRSHYDPRRRRDARSTVQGLLQERCRFTEAAVLNRGRPLVGTDGRHPLGTMVVRDYHAPVVSLGSVAFFHENLLGRLKTLRRLNVGAANLL
jgi:hypothetical protein